MRGVTVVFDLDGTLVDTAPDLMGAIDLILLQKGLAPAPHDLMRPLISHGSRAMLSAALDHLGRKLADAEFDAWWQDYLALYASNIAVRSRPFPGVLALLDRLEARGARLAVCTNKNEALSRRLLSALDMTRRFHAIAGRDTIPGAFKPDAAHVTGAIRLANGDPERALMVGDSDVDIQAARRAHIPVIGVTFGYVHAPIASFAPDAVIDHYDGFEGACAEIAARGWRGLDGV
jgi:phosphoglycolate phosphatase